MVHRVARVELAALHRLVRCFLLKAARAEAREQQVCHLLRVVMVVMEEQEAQVAQQGIGNHLHIIGKKVEMVETEFNSAVEAEDICPQVVMAVLMAAEEALVGVLLEQAVNTEATGVKLVQRVQMVLIQQISQDSILQDRVWVVVLMIQKILAVVAVEAMAVTAAKAIFLTAEVEVATVAMAIMAVAVTAVHLQAQAVEVMVLITMVVAVTAMMITPQMSQVNPVSA